MLNDLVGNDSVRMHFYDVLIKYTDNRLNERMDSVALPIEIKSCGYFVVILPICV